MSGFQQGGSQACLNLPYPNSSDQNTLQVPPLTDTNLLTPEIAENQFLNDSQDFTTGQQLTYAPQAHNTVTEPAIPLENPLACEECGKPFGNKDLLRRHKRGVHDRPFRCTKCDPPHSVGSKKDLDRHDASHHGGARKELAACPVCDYEDRLDNVNRHRRTTKH